MIGKFQIQLGAEQLISGMASSDFATDGALGTEALGLNPFVTPGIMRALANPTNITSPIVANVIASSEDSPAMNVLPSFNRTFVDTAANYYTIAGTTVNLQKTGTATTKYLSGITDHVAYAGNTYTSVTDDITKWNTVSTSLTNNWWSAGAGFSLQPNVPHPLLVYQGFLFVGDANDMHNYSDVGVVFTPDVLTLNSNEVIYALGIDPLTGLMMISVQTLIGSQDTFSAQNFVYLWDGISSKATRKIPVDDLITAFHNVEGTVFVGAGQTLGQWNGNGVTFLRKLQNVTTTGSPTDLPYKHHFANTRNILHVVDGQKILSYGEVVAGKKGFFYTGYNPANSNHITCIMPLGNNQIGVAHPTTALSVFDFSTTTAASAVLPFNNIYFPRPIFPRRIRIITTGVTTNAGSGQISVTDEKNNIINPAVPNISNFIVLAAQSPRYVFDFEFSGYEWQAIQLSLVMDTLVSFGFIRAIIYYDVAQ